MLIYDFIQSQNKHGGEGGRVAIGTAIHIAIPCMEFSNRAIAIGTAIHIAIPFMEFSNRATAGLELLDELIIFKATKNKLLAIAC